MHIQGLRSTLNVQMQQHRITLDSADKGIDTQQQRVLLVQFSVSQLLLLSIKRNICHPAVTHNKQQATAGLAMLLLPLR
jgi:hypothetical protein